MLEREVMVAQRRPLSHSNGYVRFVVLAEARTGSTLLVRALNSSPNILCFGEVFNRGTDFVLFGVDGYDNYSKRDRVLRDRDFEAFLRERIYCRQAEEIRAAGFKLLYGQLLGFPGLLDKLPEDAQIRVVHLRRRNLLRQMVSVKLLQETGVFLEDTGGKSTLASVLKAMRHPLQAAASLRRCLRSLKASGKAARVRVTISPEELFNFIVRTNQRAARSDDLFRHHRKLTVFYEHMVDHREDVFRQVQSFLGVEPGPLAVTLRKQNPEPLGELLENYDELYEAFKDTPQASFFD